MSGSYYCYLIPEAAAATYAPSVEVAATVVQALDDAGWVYHGASPVEIRVLGQDLRKRLVPAGAAAQELKALWNGADHLRVDLLPVKALTDLDTERPAESLDITPVTVGFSDCWGVSLIVVPDLAIVPADGPSGTIFACSACGRDAWSALDNVRPVQERTYWPMPLPGRAECPHCSSLLSPEHLTAVTQSASDGALKREICPFFRVAVELITDNPPPDPAPVDASLPAILAATMAVPFRVLGRFG